MDIYGQTTCCDMPAEAAPAPAAIPEPAPLPAYEPPAPVAPAAQIFPATPAAATPVVDVQPLPAPALYEPASAAPVTSGTLLGPSTVGGSSDLGGQWVNGAPDLGAGSVIGGGSPDLGISWVDANGSPVDAPYVPPAAGPFGAAAANMLSASNANINGGWLAGGSDPYPAFWTPGFDSDRDGVLNESDGRPRNRFATR